MSTGMERVALRSLYALGYAKGALKSLSGYMDDPSALMGEIDGAIAEILDEFDGMFEPIGSDGE